jgi:lipid-A-disaccharide synthase
MTRALAEEKPELVILVDSPDFNLPFAKRARRAGARVLYYVSPQVWAWRRGRVRRIAERVDRLAVIFPFEPAVYAGTGLAVEFVGHPLVDLARTRQDRSAFLAGQGLRPDAPTLALLPGSRTNELHRLGPVLAAALPRIAARVPGVQFVVACAPTLPAEAFDELAAGAGGLRPILVRDRTDDVLNACDAVITASGTATVQSALHGRPMVVVYKLSSLSYAIGKPFVSVSLYAMPNLVAGRQIVPELIQDDCTPERVAEETVSLLTDRRRRDEMQRALRDVAGRLGAPGASGRAAEAVLAVARRPRIRGAA